MRPLVLEGGEIESVEEFKYLGSVVDRRGGVMKEVGERGLPGRPELLESLRIYSKKLKPLPQHKESCVQSSCPLSIAVWV